jgi:hypothetical protein
LELVNFSYESYEIKVFSQVAWYIQWKEENCVDWLECGDGVKEKGSKLDKKKSGRQQTPSHKLMLFGDKIKKKISTCHNIFFTQGKRDDR